jgi:hypothetical protein
MLGYIFPFISQTRQASLLLSYHFLKKPVGHKIETLVVLKFFVKNRHIKSNTVVKLTTELDFIDT